MKKRLMAGMTLVFVPLLLLLALAVSEHSFQLSMQREQQRVQVSEGIIAASLRKEIGGMNYSQLQEEARHLADVYRAQGIRLELVHNGIPLTGFTLPDDRYRTLLSGGRAALLDVLEGRRVYAIADPLSVRTTLLLLRDVGDLYELRASFRRTSLWYALLGAVVTALLSWLLAYGFARPVRQLTQAARALASGAGGGAALPTERRDELGALAASFDDMREAVAQRENALREEAAQRQRMLDYLAHEMRTPLCVLLGNTRLLQQGGLEEQRREKLLGDMAREIKRLADMDTRLLTLTGMADGNLRVGRVDLLPLLRETAERLQPQKPDVRIEVTGEDAVIEGDAALLSMVADNLTANAQRFSEPGQVVTLIAFKGGFTVSDNGKGMTSEQLQRATEPFFKADQSRTRLGDGAGLGLSLCLSAAELHGGRLFLSSRPGKGTLVTFTTSLRRCEDFATREGLSSVQEVNTP